MHDMLTLKIALVVEEKGADGAYLVRIPDYPGIYARNISLKEALEEAADILKYQLEQGRRMVPVLKRPNIPPMPVLNNYPMPLPCVTYMYFNMPELLVPPSLRLQAEPR